jgi:2-keto-4-pentenoate hydratase
MISGEQVRAWAGRLETARTDQEPVAPLTDSEPELSVGDAYAIARCAVDDRVARGATIVGHKIGLTSIAVQQQLGVDQPDYGTLLSDMWVPDDGVIPVGALISPRVELELAFKLADPLDGPGVTAEDVQRATAFIQPAIEIVDSRIVDWRIALADTIADNASSGAFVLGEERQLADVDVTAVEAVLRRTGEELERGRSDAVLGDPRLAVAWLANALGELGAGLRAGDVILSGSCTRMVPAGSGDKFTGEFGDLGSVSVSFVAEA